MASSIIPSSLRTIATAVVTLLKERNETIAVVETAAGGLISASLLAVPGASKVYKGGLTLYTLPSRMAYSHWTATEIESYNGPTPAITYGLADHARKTLGSTYAVAESGTAGPTASGQGENRQPGYVALAVVWEGSGWSGDRRTGLQDREANMLGFAEAALDEVRNVLEGKKGKL